MLVSSIILDCNKNSISLSLIDKFSNIYFGPKFPKKFENFLSNFFKIFFKAVILSLTKSFKHLAKYIVSLIFVASLINSSRLYVT